MPVYDLDKTQEWLNRTMAIRKEPPVRGGVRPDHQARRQTLAGVGIVVLALLLLAALPLRRTTAPAMPAPQVEPAAAPVSTPPSTFALAPLPETKQNNVTTDWQSKPQRADTRPILDIMPQSSDRSRPSGRSSTVVPPHAPIWLDGK